MELERGSDTKANESFKYVLLLNKDGTYSNYAGKYTINDTDNEFSKGISETLSENKEMNMECCIIVVWNEEWDRFDYYVQTRADGHNQIGSIPNQGTQVLVTLPCLLTLFTGHILNLKKRDNE